MEGNNQLQIWKTQYTVFLSAYRLLRCCSTRINNSPLRVMLCCTVVQLPSKQVEPVHPLLLRSAHHVELCGKDPLEQD